jgi:hypothetical protein
MRKSLITLAGACLLSADVAAEVRVYVEDAGGVAWIKYECTAGEVIRSFALDISVDRGQITGISDFFTGTCSASARGYGIFPASFRDHITVSSGSSANWSVSGYDPLAVVADAPADTLGGLGTSGVTLELGALWDPALPATAPPASGTLCALHLSQGAYVRVAANASRGGVVASPDGNVVAPTFAAAAVGVLPEIAVEQPAGTNLASGGSSDFGSVTVGSNTSLTFTIRNTGTADLTGLTITRDGTHPAEFTITSNPLPPVSGPGGTTSFTVRFAPVAGGPRGAVLHLANNDVDENPFDIHLGGTGVLSPLQTWRQIHFGSIDNSGDGADLNDFENDGLRNLVEFAFGLDPKQNSAGMLPLPQRSGNTYVISFTEPAGVSGITYGAEWSTTLLSESWTTVADTGTPPQHTFSVLCGKKSTLYMRLKVTNP